MMQVPLINPELEERFATQIMCTYVESNLSLPASSWSYDSPVIFDNNTMVVLVHEL